MNAKTTDQAITKWREALARSPDSVEVLVGLGDSLIAADQATEAAEYYRQALQKIPHHAALLYALGTAEVGAGQLAEAREHLIASLAQDETNPHAHNNLAALYRRTGEPEEAARHYQRALELKPDLASARAGIRSVQSPEDRLKNLLMSSQAHIRAGDFAAAKSGFQSAVIRAPLSSHAWEGLAVALLGLGDSSAALEACETAIKYDAGNLGARHHKALALRALSRLPEAIAAFDDILSDLPDEHMSRAARGALLMELGKYADAIPDLAASVDHIRDASQPAILGALAFAHRAIADWSTAYHQAREDLIHRLSVAGDNDGAMMVSPFHLQPLDIPLELERDVARQAGLKASVGAENLAAEIRRLGPGERIRLGYLSADFFAHSLAWAIKDLIPLHDRARFEVEGFALNRNHDQTTRYFASAFDVLHDISGFDNIGAARFIAGRGIDILIDLAGHTKGGRLEILAHKPAPVQLHAIGYGRSLCAPFLPWRLTDRISIPAQTRNLFDETLIDLPDNALPASPPPKVDTSITRHDLGLAEGVFVFANFGGPYKIDPGVFDQWMTILNGAPDAVLALLGLIPQSQANLVQAAAARGVAAERLVFVPYLEPARHHGRYRLVDLCLDTLIHNGGVTTTDALWAGTPVLTTYRSDMPDRTGASLLHAAGMAELVAADNDAYVAKAIEIATTPGAAVRLRQMILARHESAALFDMEKYTRNFEAALLDVWARASHTPEKTTSDPSDGDRTSR